MADTNTLTGSSGVDLVDGHLPANERGWTSCLNPQEQMSRHPDNCVHASRLRYRSSIKMTYDEYAARRDERDQLARDRAVAGALAVLSGHYGLTVDDIKARLSPAGLEQNGTSKLP